MIMGRLGCPLGSLKRPARNIASRDPRSQYSISIHVSMCFSTLQAGSICIISVLFTNENAVPAMSGSVHLQTSCMCSITQYNHVWGW